MSIPPLLSSTPPPLEESGSLRDHDDDFGEFSDHASVGAVSSTTSIPDSSSLFQPIDTSKSSAGLHETVTNQQLDGLREDDDEWSEFDSAVVEQSSEAVHNTDLTDFVKDEKLVAHEPVSGSTEELSTESATQAIISKQLHLGDVPSSCYNDVEVECNDGNSLCDVISRADKLERESVNTASSEDADLTQCTMAEIRHPVDEIDDRNDDKGAVLDSTSDSEDLEYHYAIDSAEQDVETEHNDSSQASSAGTASDTNEYGFAADNEPASDENDFVDDFQSFSNDTVAHQDSVIDNMRPNMPEDLNFTSYKDEEESSACIEVSADSQPLSISCSADLSSSAAKKSSSSTVAKDNGILAHEQMLPSDDEVSDDFADFEAFVSAKAGPAEHELVVDSGAYHWSAFEDTNAAAADDDDWAAFQDSDQTAVLASKVSDRNAALIQQPVMEYSGQLSKVHNFLADYPFLKSKLTPIHDCFC